MMFNDRYGLTQAVISGRKTVTRRVIKDAWWPIYKIEAEGMRGNIINVIANNGKLVIEHKCPYKIGEIVAVAQCYADIHSELMIGDFGNDCYDSFKNAVVHDKAGWHNKMFVRADLMPHRIQITDIRIERLQDISDEDCLREGVQYIEAIDKYYFEHKDREEGFYFDSPREAFASLIDKVSGRGTWDRNPFVWRIEFELVK